VQLQRIPVLCRSRVVGSGSTAAWLRSSATHAQVLAGLRKDRDDTVRAADPHLAAATRRVACDAGISRIISGRLSEILDVGC
jgi:hypothetical protein